MTPPVDTSERVRAALRAGAAHLELPHHGPEAARLRARQRTRRGQAVVAAVAALAIGGGGLAAYTTLTAGDSVRIGDVGTTGAPPAPDTAPGEVPGAADNPLADLEWREHDGTLSHVTDQVLSADGYTYVLSTAPGARYEDHPDGIVPQALYRSVDGASWETADLGADPWIADLTSRDGVLYAITTAPLATGGDIAVAASTDGGSTWEHHPLPVADTPPPAIPLDGTYHNVHVAAGDDTLVASVRTGYRPDFEAIFGADVMQDHWVAIEDDGLVLHPVGPGATEPAVAICDAAGGCREPEAEPEGIPVPTTAPEATGRLTWAELGLSGRTDLERHELFTSTDGTDWQPVPSPFGPGAIAPIVATSQGFFTTVTDHGGATATSVLMRSADGVTWEVANDQLGWIDLVGEVGGRLLALSSADTQQVLTSADGGATWTTVDLGALTGVIPGPEGPWVIAADTGPLGAALVTSIFDEAGPARVHLLTSVDGTTWTATPTEELLDGDAPGTSPSWVSVGADSVAIGMSWRPVDGEVDPHHGDPRLEARTWVGTPTR